MEAKNTFENGMYIDNDPQAQPKGTYRDSRNGEVFSLGGNNYIWKPSNGTVAIQGTPENAKLLGSFPAREKLVLFHHDETTLLDYIGLVSKVGGEYIYSVLYVYNLGFTSNNLIKGYSNYEDSQTEKIYWTDDNIKPKSLNILGVNPFAFPVAPNVGKKYLVRENRVLHEGAWYEPGDTFVFWTYSSLQWEGNLNLIEFIEPDVLDWDIKITFTDKINHEIVTGGLTVGLYYSSYRFITLNNDTTPWSPLSESVALLITNGAKLNSSTSQIDQVKTWHYDNGGPAMSNSGKAIKLTLSGIEFDKYAYIEFCCFRSTTDEIIEAGVIFERLLIDNIRTVFMQSSQELSTSLLAFSGETITLSNFLSESISLEKVEDLCQIKNMNVNSVTKEEQDITFDYKWEQELNGEHVVKTLIHETPADVLDSHPENYNTEEPYYGLFSLDSDGYVIQKGILTKQWYEVFTSEVIYNSITYNPGDHFEGVSEHSEWTGVGKIKPVLRICKYFKNEGLKEIPVWEYRVITSNNYQKGSEAVNLAGYWGQEKYRLGVLPISLTGKKLPVRWLADYIIPERNGTEKNEFYAFNSNDELISTGGKLTTLHNRENETGRFTYQTNTNQATLLVTIDLTDIIDQISGFSIVRSKRENGRIAEGVINQVFLAGYIPIGESELIERYCRNIDYGGGQNINNVWLFDELGSQSSEQSDHLDGDLYNEARNMGAPLNSAFGNEFYVDPYWTDRFRILKAYDHNGLNKTYNPTTILSAAFINTADKDVPIEKEAVAFNNYTFEKIDNNIQKTKFDGSAPTVMLTCKSDKQWTNTGSKDALPSIVEKIRGSSDYGDTADSSLQGSNYILTGHYQPITPEFRNYIFKDGKWIAKNIQVMGGDCYVTLYAYQRVPGNRTRLISGGGSVYYPSTNETLIIPIQSLYNNQLRYGRTGGSDGLIAFTFDKKEITKTEIVTDWVFPEGDQYLWEEFDIVSAFKNTYGGISYESLALLSKKIVEYKNRIRWSTKKSIGNIIDSYTEFPVLNFLDIPGEEGFITNLKAKGSRLFVWLTNGIVYIPVTEKALTNGQLGETIYLGIGNEFERVDQIYKTYGNQHKFGLAETDDKWFWYDAYRKTMLSMSFNGKLTPESIVKGMDTFFQEQIGDSDKIDVIAGFNPKEKIVCFTFVDLTNLDNSKTISISDKNQKFNCNYDYTAYNYATWLNEMFTTSLDKDIVYRHNIEGSTVFHDKSFSSKITVVINGEDILKKFMSAKFKGSRQFFDTIKYESQYDPETETFLNSIEENSDYNYDFVIDEWRAGIPAGNLGRMDGRYLVVTLTTNGKTKGLKLLSISTNYIKLY